MADIPSDDVHDVATHDGGAHGDHDTRADRGKRNELDLLSRDLPEPGQTSFTRQQAPLGLGHAVWCARELVGNEPFALLLPDMLHHSKRPCLADMIDAYDQYGGNHVAVSPVPEDQTHLYGIVGVADSSADVTPIKSMIEKPPRGTAPSNLHITGRYILNPEIFDLLAKQERGSGGEIQLTDALARLVDLPTEQGGGVHAVVLRGKRYDTGDKLSYLQSVISIALERPEFGGELRAWLVEYLKDNA